MGWESPSLKKFADLIHAVGEIVEDHHKIGLDTIDRMQKVQKAHEEHILGIVPPKKEDPSGVDEK
jgi:hypothetical protein